MQQSKGKAHRMSLNSLCRRCASACAPRLLPSLASATNSSMSCCAACKAARGCFRAGIEARGSGYSERYSRVHSKSHTASPCLICFHAQLTPKFRCDDHLVHENFSRKARQIWVPIKTTLDSQSQACSSLNRSDLFSFNLWPL